MKKYLPIFGGIVSIMFQPQIVNASQPLGTIVGGRSRWGPGVYDRPTVIALFNNAVSVLIGLLTILAALYFMFQIFISGYDWITAGGDSNKINIARNRLTHGLLGLTVVVSAYALIGLVSSMFGIMVFNPLSDTNIFQ